MAEDVTKLPRWAQTRIESAERNVEHWKGLALQVSEGQSDTLVRSFMEERFLPAGSTVDFGVVVTEHANGHVSRRGVSCSWRDEGGVGQLYVNGGSDMLFVRPQAQNALWIMKAPR